MPKFSVNLTMLFGEVPFEERFDAGKQAGFRYVEYMFPYDYKAEDLADRLKKNDLQQVLFNLPAGNWAEGDRGIAGNPARIEAFRQGVDQALEYAKALNVVNINCLVGFKSPYCNNQTSLHTKYPPFSEGRLQGESF